MHRNDRLPVRTRRRTHHARDQAEIQLTVVAAGQAERTARGREVLVQGAITGIRPATTRERGAVSFEMGFDGVLHVTAFHVDAGLPLVLRATTGATLSQAEVARERAQLGRMRRRG